MYEFYIYKIRMWHVFPIKTKYGEEYKIANSWGFWNNADLWYKFSSAFWR